MLTTDVCFIRFPILNNRFVVDWNDPSAPPVRSQIPFPPPPCPRKEGRGKDDVVVVRTSQVYMANRMRNATIRQNRPMASDRAKPRMA